MWLQAEAELLSAIVMFFSRLGITSNDVGIKVSNRKVCDLLCYYPTCSVISCIGRIGSELCCNFDTVDGLGKLLEQSCRQFICHWVGGVCGYLNVFQTWFLHILAGLEVSTIRISLWFCDFIANLNEVFVLFICWVVIGLMSGISWCHVVGTRQVLQAVLEKFNIPPDSFAAVCVIVDKVQDKLIFFLEEEFLPIFLHASLYCQQQNFETYDL